MSVAQAPSKPRNPKKARKPDPSRIYQMVVYERQTNGPRGAANRVAEQTGLSDDTIRRIIARIEKPDDTPAELTYKPYDATYEARLPILNAPIAKAVQEAATAHKTLQTSPNTVAYVETTPQEISQDKPPEMRPLMSTIDCDNAVFEREMKNLRLDEVSTTPQTKTAQYRILEHGKLPQEDVATSQIREYLATSTDTTNPTAQNCLGAMEVAPTAQRPDTSISMRADYIRQHITSRQHPTPTIRLRTIVTQFLQPGPMLAVMIFAILIGVMYWK